MRDYLFRGKQKDNDRWVYGSLIHVGDFCCILDPDDEGPDYPYMDKDLGIIDGYVTPVKPETVGQFTGICDKTGERIFEGDIVHAFMDFGPAGFLPQATDIRYLGTRGYQWEYFDMDTIVIIGNVYDTPELLRGE